MSESNNHRDPFKDDPDNHETITSLVQKAVQTHREPEQSTRKRRRYPTEDQRSKMTIDLDPDTIAQLREVAKREKAGVSVTAQALLDYAMEAYESGRLKFERRPATTRFVLEPVDAEGNGN
jgi:macrodomain Ter protein organizer (MatP/YcbG family)